MFLFVLFFAPKKKNKLEFKALREFLPNFQQEETGKNLD